MSRHDTHKIRVIGWRRRNYFSAIARFITICIMGLVANEFEEFQGPIYCCCLLHGNSTNMSLEAVRALNFVDPFIRTSFSDSCRDAKVFYSGCAILFLAGFAQAIDLSLLENAPPRHLLDTYDW